MTRTEFEQLVADVGLSSVPEPFREKIRNVAFIIEDEPDEQTRELERLADDETLLGLYHGIPHTARGDGYGVGMTLPDTITLYQKPIEEAGAGDRDMIREVIAETIWHEVAHHFGLEHDEMEDRYHASDSAEKERD